MGPRRGFGFDPLDCESRFAIALGEPALNGVEPAFGVLGSPPCPFGQAAQLGLKRQVRVVPAPRLEVLGIQPDHTGLEGIGLVRARGATTTRAWRGIIKPSCFRTKFSPTSYLLHPPSYILHLRADFGISSELIRNDFGTSSELLPARRGLRSGAIDVEPGVVPKLGRQR